MTTENQTTVDLAVDRNQPGYANASVATPKLSVRIECK